MDDLHLDPLARPDWHTNQRHEDSRKRRPRPPHAELFEERVDTVVLSSDPLSNSHPQDG